VVRIPGFGRNAGGRERETKIEFEERKARALGWHVEPPDPVQQQLSFIAGDRTRYPDEAIAGEIDVLFGNKTVEERQALVRRVDLIRHPEKAEQAGLVTQDKVS